MSASNWQPFFYSCSDWSWQVNLVSVCLCVRKTKGARGREKQKAKEKLIWFVRKDVCANVVSMTSVCQRVGSELPMSGGMSDHGNTLRENSRQPWRPADEVQHLEIDEGAPLEWRVAVERENVVQIKCNSPPPTFYFCLCKDSMIWCIFQLLTVPNTTIYLSIFNLNLNLLWRQYENEDLVSRRVAGKRTTMNTHMHEFISPGSESSPSHTSKVSLAPKVPMTIFSSAGLL